MTRPSPIPLALALLIPLKRPDPSFNLVRPSTRHSIWRLPRRFGASRRSSIIGSSAGYGFADLVEVGIGRPSECFT